MKTFRLTNCLLLLAGIVFADSPCLSQSSAAKPQFHVTGVVLRADTNVPVSRCHLSMRPEGQDAGRRRGSPNSDLLTVDTDPQGRFAFDLPAEGSWQLSASGTGYRTQFYNEHEGFSSAVVLRSGLPAPSLVFHLEPDSTLSGFVRDEAGEPVRSALLFLQLATQVQAGGGRRQRAMTDDRGHYEIAGIAPGSYRISVQATPWYTTGGQAKAGDPVFDVVYPLTWYPGVFEADAAGEISLHDGAAQQIDFNLLPVPAGHLRLSEIPRSNPSLQVAGPTIERIENGPGGGILTQLSGSSGQTDLGGLAPGLYRVSQPQADGQVSTSFVHVSAGATISLSPAGSAGTADVIFHMQGDDRSDRSLINLTDTVGGAVFTSFSGGSFGLRRRPPPQDNAAIETAPAERRLSVPAGRYQVTLDGDPELSLTSMALKGKPIAGRIVTLTGGPAALTLNVARGRVHVSGHAILAGRPVEGAMVLLVPTSFGQAGAIDLVRRDQSNTDGSFELADVIPGDYILLAIDHGWSINWHDLSTLSRYLLQGVPLSLQPQSRLQQEIAAQAP